MTKNTETGTAVAAAQNTAVATSSAADLPEHLRGREDIAGLGNSRDAQDNTLPFLGILQKGSPQVNKQEPEYIKGAEAGFLLNTATGQIWTGEEGLPFIPCGIQKNYVQWRLRNEGGGYVDTHPFDVELIKKLGARKNETGQIMMPDGTQLVETLYTFGLLPGFQQAVIGASSTALKPMRDWMALRNTVMLGAGKVAPAFAKVYDLRTVYQKNDKGDWYNWKITPSGWTSKEEFDVALEFANMIAQGTVKLGRPDQDLGSTPTDEGDGGIPL